MSSTILQSTQILSRIIKYIALLVCFFSALHADTIAEKAPFLKPSSCTAEIWSAMEPYFLPANHPNRKALDTIFSQMRVLNSVKNLKKAGFVDPHAKYDNGAYITRHPRLPGYVIKCYLDTQDTEDWFKLLRRVQGAQLVQATLNEYNFNHLIKVPNKWIYPLPENPPSKTGEGYFPKHFILIAQDAGVLSSTGNAYAWKHSMTRELLTAIYIVISQNCMTDSIRISNIPFCFDGKIAFIDTEYFDVPNGEVRYWKLFDYLSSEMAAYLKGLAENGVPR